MSMGEEMDVRCACGHLFKAFIWQTVNVTLKPELRTQILAGEMNMVKCPSCGESFHVEVPFLYHDMKRREWIWVYPLAYQKDGPSVQGKVQDMWHKIRETMPPEYRERYESEYEIKVLFGMDALVYYIQSRDDDNGPSN